MGDSLRPEIVSLEYVRAEGGGILKAMSRGSEHYCGFGELYFSELEGGVFRGWKTHTRSTSFILVLGGEASFHFVFSDKDCETIHLGMSTREPVALRIPRGLTFGFRAIGNRNLLVCNLASETYDPEEALRPPLNFHNCDWSGQ